MCELEGGRKITACVVYASSAHDVFNNPKPSGKCVICPPTPKKKFVIHPLKEKCKQSLSNSMFLLEKSSIYKGI